jgi:hypothetical protein
MLLLLHKYLHTKRLPNRVRIRIAQVTLAGGLMLLLLHKYLHTKRLPNRVRLTIPNMTKVLAGVSGPSTQIQVHCKTKRRIPRLMTGDLTPLCQGHFLYHNRLFILRALLGYRTRYFRCNNSKVIHMDGQLCLIVHSNIRSSSSSRAGQICPPAHNSQNQATRPRMIPLLG